MAWLRSPGRSSRLGAVAFTVGACGLFGAFIALGALFVGDQFQYEYVHNRGSVTTDLKYKIAGIWAGQEGSFLLWAVCSALFGLFAMPRVGPEYRRWFTIAYSVFLAAIAGILAFETPFRVWDIEGSPLTTVPPDGVGLVPSLQNYWVVIHPPVIFLGFGSLTVLAAWSVAALATANPWDWAARARSWAIIATTLCGLGLCLGGFWAYETLGWGGFWAWDPVENVSFVPWLLGACLIHGLIVQTRRRKWVPSNLLFAGLPFLSFVYGTFLTRSGFLAETSVHSFAQMERTAHFLLLGFFIASTVGFITLWSVQTGRYRHEWAPPADDESDGLIRRENMYRMGSALLVGMALATGFGMSVPMIMALTGREPKVVEEVVYHNILVWLFVPVMLLIGIGPFVAWRKMGVKELLRRLVNVLSLTFGLLGFAVFLLLHPRFGASPDRSAVVSTPVGNFYLVPWVLFLVAICLFAFVANLWRAGEMWKRARASTGGFVAHIGLAVLMTGLIVSRGLQRSDQIWVQQDSPAVGVGYLVQYQGVYGDFIDRNTKVLFEVVDPDGRRFQARPGHYYTFPREGEPQAMVWPHVERRWNHDVYVALYEQIIDGEASDAETFAVGETRTLNNLYEITYEGLERDGEPGQVGTEFRARVTILGAEGEATAAPAIRIASGGEMNRRPVQLNEHYMLVLERIDAATDNAVLQLRYVNPWYPIQIFYKPWTSLVWLGTGILTFGGFMAAWDKRRRRRREASDAEHAIETAP